MTRNGHRTFLKWHRGRRRLGDPVFTGARILEGMALGASVEVDLVVTGDGGFAVLHDLTLDRETTGSGPVAAASDATIRTLRLRGNDGQPIDAPVMLLDDLCALMARADVPAEALLQLDYKQDETVLDARALANFVRATGPVATNLIVSSGSAPALAMLAAAVPGLRSGYDATDEASFRTALAAGTLQGWVDRAIEAAPGAQMIYLHYDLVLGADDSGFDLVDAFHRHGRTIDAWTIRTTDERSVALVRRLLALRVDQITTDDPEGLAAALDR